ncbi:uncharacterized protein BXZ73DRAFT_78903 [Epithele typhae]|uniref:uncharacterized protein n=1 Tax=Epithele typhae TaxID=378194 RepID=UPI002008EA2B|nr:uncharacterized protein BXZ73DRAFT_78903 [Epithele typhae]KAH9925926.1 hypothetical protein BXZ73DRAFT_78903 [Epithele typhae]
MVEAPPNPARSVLLGDTAAAVAPTTTAAAAGASEDALRVFGDIQASLGGLESALGAVGMQAAEMKQQEDEQEEHIKDIQALCLEVLEKDVLQHLTALIEAGVLEDIDKLVQEHVAQLLPHYLPRELQLELREQQAELERLEKQLHDSEHVHSIHNAKGKSARDSRDLSHMFALTSSAAEVLVREYGLGEPSPVREKNINVFMRHCGVQYHWSSQGLENRLYPGSLVVAFV